MKYNLYVCETLIGKYGIGGTQGHWKTFESKEKREEFIKKLKEVYDKVEFYAHEVNGDSDCTYINADKENIEEPFEFKY